MIEQPFEFELELLSRSPRRVLGRGIVQPDLVPVREALILDLLRSGAIEQPGQMPVTSIEPVWEDRIGPPLALGFRASAIANGVEASRTFSISFFRDSARLASRQYVESGHLQNGEVFDFSVRAHKRRQPVGKPTFKITPREMPLPIKDESLSEAMREALLFGGADCRSDMPLFIDWPVLQETAALTRQARPKETGGLLLGSICRDRSIPELFLHITGQVHAQAEGQLSKLSFDAETWTRLQADVNQRGGDVTWLGWYHNHSYFHDANHDREKDRAEETPGRKVIAAFLSEDDLHVHRTVFPRAFGAALLITDSPHSGLAWDLFSWRNGVVVPRSFHVLGAPMLANSQENKGVSDEPQRKLSCR